MAGLRLGLFADRPEESNGPRTEECGMKRTGKRDGKPAKRAKAVRPPTANPRLTEQTRKILGKHYANEYRSH